MPTSAPTIPPTVPSAPAPARAAMIGPAEHATRDNSRSGTGGRSFGGFRILLMSKILGAGVIGEQRRDVGVAKANPAKRVNRLFRFPSRVKDPENRYIFFRHDYFSCRAIMEQQE